MSLIQENPVANNTVFADPYQRLGSPNVCLIIQFQVEISSFVILRYCFSY